jgi:hypothetical protein
MGKPVRRLGAALAIIAACLTAGSCGSGDNPTIVRFQGPSRASISLSTLDHWMKVMVGGDIRQNLSAEGPTGLASEPADYTRCFAAAKLVAPRSFFNQIRYDRVQITEKCHQLHHVIKRQALDFLILAHWATAEAAERGLTASAADLQAAFRRARKRSYPTESALRRYLRERHWSLSDLLYQLKVELLADRRHESTGASAFRERSDWSSTARLASERLQSVAARTHCTSGYVVPGCSEYRGAPMPSPSPASVIEDLTGNRSESSTGSA